VRSSEADQAAIIAACRQFLAADLVETACLARAPGSSSYRVRLNDRQSVIVKLYFDNSSWKAAHERRIIQALSRDATIRTAALVGCGQIDESAAALITVDLGDLTLWRAVEENECLGHEALQLIGYLLAMFHNIDLAIAASSCWETSAPPTRKGGGYRRHANRAIGMGSAVRVQEAIPLI